MDEKIVRFSWPHENDLVFRRDAIEAIIRETNQDGAYGYGDTKSLVNVLDALPSAQPERIKGRWIEKPHVYGVAYCSLCDYELHTNDTNFCPNCGADMKGEQE